jgi:hypothetical protein
MNKQIISIYSCLAAGFCGIFSSEMQPALAGGNEEGHVHKYI